MFFLLHYKFMNGDMVKYIERAKSGNYASGSLEYKTYLERLQSGKGINFFYEDSKEFINSISLLELDKKIIEPKDYFQK